MKRKEATSPGAALASASRGDVRVGILVRRDGARPWVELPGVAGGPFAARSLVALTPAVLGEAVAQRRGVVLLLEEGDPTRPIIAGFLQPDTATPALDAAVEATLAGAPVTAEVDGKKRLIEAEQELVLRCGEASITLRRDGKVVIRGVQVETRAAGTNRIKGGTVKIN